MIIHMIGNAHIDPVWLWRWPEGMSEMTSTCRTMVKMLNESDDLVFTKGEAAMYEWIERTDPLLFKQIQDLVKKGRWNIVNGWWVQPDCNLPNGESFVRQSLYGKRYFSEKFKVDVRVGYNVDSFGHAGSLPQILKKSGFDYYVFMRPGPNEKLLPSIFRWRSIDGSEVIAFRLSRNYETRRDRDNLSVQIETSIKDALGHDSTMAFYGVGDHGGGPTMSQVKYIRKHKKFDENTILEFSSPEKYFDSIKDKTSKLSIVEDELQYHSIGAYSVNSKMKLLNRKSENALLTAEKFATLANIICGIDYPYSELENAWKTLLFNQFHDLLGGTAIKEAYEDAYNELGSVISTAEKIKQISMQSIIKDINTEGNGMPFVVFNPSAFEREEYVELEPWLNWEPWRNKILVDAEGNEIIYQRINPSEIMRKTYRILFKAKIPPMGYSVYWLKNGKSLNSKSMSVNGNIIENDFYRLEISKDGYFKSFYDKGKSIDYFQKASNLLFVIDDKTDTWSHGISGYPRKYELTKGNVRLIEHGSLRSTFRIEHKYKNSRIVEYVNVYADEPVLKIHFVVDWHEPFKLLKVGYFLNDTPEISAEIPYGMIKRSANGQEYPMQRAIFLENGSHGLMIANNGKYAYDVLDNEARITILRNTPYAWHMPCRIGKDRPLYFSDSGMQEFDLWLWPYFKDEKWKGLKIAQSLNEPLEVLSVPKHIGKLPSRDSFLKVEGENILMEVLKMSESRDNNLIMRIWETTGADQEFSVNAFGKSKTLGIKKHEIKTIKIGRNSFEEVNLLEK